MQHQEGYTPLSSNSAQHHDSKTGTHLRGQPSPREAAPSGAPLPPHIMTQSLQQQHQHQRPRSYQAPPSSTAPDASLPPPSVDPLPPHLQHMVPPHIRSVPLQGAAPRPSGIPDHLQPRPIPQQRRQQQQRDQEPSAQQQQQQQQQQAGYSPPGAAHMGSAPEPAGGVRHVGAPPLAQVGSGGVLQHGVPSPSSARPTHSAGPHYAQQQEQRQRAPQQRPYDNADYPQGSAASAAPMPPQQAHPLRHAQRQQYSPPPSQSQQPPAQQYHQHPSVMIANPLPGFTFDDVMRRLSHARTAVVEDDDQQQLHSGPILSGTGKENCGPVPMAASGQVSLPTGPSTGPPISNSAPPAVQPPANDGLQYAPPQPVQLKPSLDATATSVSFVQLVQQPGGIQVDQSGAVRVVPKASLDASATSSVVPPRVSSSQHPPVVTYAPMPAPAAAPAEPQLLPPHMAREPQLAPQHLYDPPPAPYQQPVGPQSGGGGGVVREDAPGGHRQGGGYPPQTSSLHDPGDGRIYVHVPERLPPPPHPVPQPAPPPQDSGYLYPDQGAPGRYAGRAGVVERHGSRGDLGPNLDGGMVADGYASPSGMRPGGVERYGPTSEGGRGDVPRQLSGDGRGPGMAQPPPRQGGVAAVPDGPPLPLAEAVKRCKDFLEAVRATRRVGDLMMDMLPRLLDKCQNEIHELSRSLEVGAADVAAAQAAADAAAAAVAKAAEEEVQANADDDLSNLRANHHAFLVERSIRAVWPLDTPEHELYRAAAELLLLEEGGRVVSVNNEEVQLQPHEMVGATLCNVPELQERVADVRAAGGGSTMTLLRQEPAYFNVWEHTHKQDHKGVQRMVRLRVEKLPSYSDLRRLLRAAIDALLPAPPQSTKRELPQQQQRQGSGRAPVPTPTKSRGGSHSTGRDAGDSSGAGGATGGGKPSDELQFLGREPEGAQDRLVLRHVALHLLGCQAKDIGLFNDTVESALESLPSHLAHLYSKSRVQDFKQLLLSHPFFWVSLKSAYASDGLTSKVQDCVALHTNTVLQFQYRARLVLQQEQQQQQAKKRKGASVSAVPGSGAGAESADCTGALEQWWLELRRKRPKLHAI